MLNPRDIVRAMGGTVSNGAALVPGPGHKPHDRSLSIKVDTNAPEGFVVHSFANDDPIMCRDYVKQKLGLPAWQPARSESNGHKVSVQSAPKPQAAPIVIGDDGPPKIMGELRRHVYRRDGDPVRVKIKITRDGQSSYQQWFAAGDGWQPKKPDGYRAVPFTATGLDPFDRELQADAIYWPEGEKDVNTLAKHNLLAFTFGGVGDGLPNDAAAYLSGRHIVILADNDAAGSNHAEEKAARANVAGAASIRVVRFQELEAKGDVSDYFAAGGTADDLVKRADAMPQWAPLQSFKTSTAPHWRNGAITADVLQGMAFPPVRYVVPGYITEGVSILAAKPKVGKSWLMLDVCIAVASGRFTLGTIKPPQGDVLCLAMEDSKQRLKRRLRKLLPQDSKWPDRLLLKTEWRRTNEGGLADIVEWCDSVAAPTLILVDTLEKIRPITNGKQQAYSADYEAITGLQKIANERGVAIVIVHHLRKMESDDPFDTVSGTLGLTGAADTILVLKRQSGGYTLYARGRDIEESETALQFARETCRWSILGAAAEVHVSNERAAVIGALKNAGPDGLTVPEIMAATESTSRGAVDALLFKMKGAGEIERPKRGVYVLPQDAGKIGKKERNEGQTIEIAQYSSNLTDLTDLTGGKNGAEA